jgi:hypothetical protein
MPGTKPIIALTEAAQAAAAAAKQANANAAGNAAKPGIKTTEFWVTVLGAAGAVLAGALLPTPIGPIAAAAIGLGSFGYSRSRGDVKAAALAAVQGAASAAAGEGGTLGDVGGIVEQLAGR